MLWEGVLSSWQTQSKVHTRGLRRSLCYQAVQPTSQTIQIPWEYGTGRFGDNYNILRLLLILTLRASSITLGLISPVPHDSIQAAILLWLRSNSIFRALDGLKINLNVNVTRTPLNLSVEHSMWLGKVDLGQVMLFVMEYDRLTNHVSKVHHGGLYLNNHCSSTLLWKFVNVQRIQAEQN